MKSEDPIATAIESIVDAGALAGAATLIWRDGQVVQIATAGWRDVETRLPIERDILFRIASILLGLLIACIENAPLDDVLKRKIFDHLGMKDTGFTVPREKGTGERGCTALARLVA